MVSDSLDTLPHGQTRGILAKGSLDVVCSAMGLVFLSLCYCVDYLSTPQPYQGSLPFECSLTHVMNLGKPKLLPVSVVSHSNSILI